MKKNSSINNSNLVSPGVSLNSPLDPNEENDEEYRLGSDSINRYSVEKNSIQKLSIFHRITRKRFGSFPLILYIFLIPLILSLIFFFYYLYSLSSEKYNFKIVELDWDKVPLNDRGYEFVVFDNGLEVMVIQDKNFDMDGGAILIENGYLDNPFDEGVSKLAGHILHKHLLDKSLSTSLSTERISDYYGSYVYETKEHYTTYKFNILNWGFLECLKNFSQVLKIPDQRDFEKYFNQSIDEIQILFQDYSMKDETKKEHLLQYLVHGLKNQKGEDICPEGNYQVYHSSAFDFFKIKTYDLYKEMINPSKIKIVLFSKYKKSITSKYMKKFFNYLTELPPVKEKNKDKDKEKENTKDIINDSYNYTYKTKQIIRYPLSKESINFIAIHYYIERNNNETYSDLYFKENYFNYIVDILQETKDYSLYWLLTHSNDLNIKSIESYYDIVMKSTIRFTINIELNVVSLTNLNDIIFLTYQYMDTIVSEAIGENLQEDRYKELLNKYSQALNYAEKSYNTITLAENNANRLYMIGKHFKYYFYSEFIPDIDMETVKKETQFYFSQLTPENSVIVFGIRDDDIENIKCQNNSYFYLNCSKLFFDATSEKETKYFSTLYSVDDLDTNFTQYFHINITENVSYIPNEYISSHHELYEKADEKKDYGIIENHTLNTFYFVRDLNYGVPRVFISINLLHPYLRPMNADKDQRDCFYFQILEMFSAIQRKITFDLADAIRAGNRIDFGFNENYLYINVVSFNDVAEKIMKKIKNIIFDRLWSKSSFVTNNKMYQSETVENYFNIWKGYDIEIVAKNYLICAVKNNLYNRFEFFPDEFDFDKCIDENFEDEVRNLNKFSVNGFIYGDFTLEQAQNISKLFNKKNEEDEENFFDYLLDYVENDKVSVSNYSLWIKEINHLKSIDKKFVNMHTRLMNKNAYNICFRYIFYAGDNIYDYIDSSLFWIMFNNRDYNYYVDTLYSSSMFSYNDLYFEIGVLDPYNHYVDPNNYSNIINITEKSINENIKSYEKIVDDLGDRFYYLSKNFYLTISEGQSTLEKKGLDTLNALFYSNNKAKVIKEEDFDNYISTLSVDEITQRAMKKIKNNITFDVNTVRKYSDSFQSNNSF